LSEDLDRYPAGDACAEPGRRMFFEFAGRYFARWPRFEPAPRDAPCSVCGGLYVPLWMNDSKMAVCLAQQTITRKRRARTSAAEPLAPGGGPGKTNLSGGHFAVVGPNCALLVTNLVPDAAIPPGLEVRYGGPGSITKAKMDLLLSPPPAPFVAVAFQKSAGHPIRITTDPSRIVLNGNGACVLDRPYLEAVLQVLRRLDAKAARDMLHLRQRLAGGTDYKTDKERERDQEALLRLRAGNAVTAADFRRLPPPGSPEARFVLEALGLAETPGGADTNDNEGTAIC
jgi:hypothetical protein